MLGSGMPAASPSVTAVPLLGGYVAKIIVRRYSAGTRPWVPFHADSVDVTVNVALASDAAHHGGRLAVVCDGQVRLLAREEGEAVVHSSALLHAVTAMTAGVRFSLIIFMERRA
jgi:predicted 2-oxoglutarate/Fe(II)-dependent dioxygenase YbiX